MERVVQSLERLLSHAPSNPDAPTPWIKKSIPELIDHILQTHHTFTKVQLQKLLKLSEKVSREHGSRYPDLIRLHGLLGTMAEELEGHLAKEEEVLFPYLRRLWDRSQNKDLKAKQFPKEVFQETRSTSWFGSME